MAASKGARLITQLLLCGVLIVDHSCTAARSRQQQQRAASGKERGSTRRFKHPKAAYAQGKPVAGDSHDAELEKMVKYDDAIEARRKAYDELQKLTPPGPPPGPPQLSWSELHPEETKVAMAHHNTGVEAEESGDYEAAEAAYREAWAVAPAWDAPALNLVCQPAPPSPRPAPPLCHPRWLSAVVGGSLALSLWGGRR
jgi:tetratricopeptide (TPR) repeat protein